jgi:hypothetical protein
MPVSANLSTSLVRDANVALALSFFPRWRKGFWAKICGETKSTRPVEPFALLGATPLPRSWLPSGMTNSQPINSFSQYIPNLLMKSWEYINRYDVEFDQTKTLLSRVNAHGVRLNEVLDYLCAKRIVTGASASSATTVSYWDNKSYNLTFENGIPPYATNHNTYIGGNQSNIVQGQLPATVAGIAAQNISVTVNQLQQDLMNVITQITGYKDDKGVLLYPDFDPAKHLVVAVPPILWMAAKLGFTSPSAVIGGSNGTNGSSGSVTNITPMFIKDVIMSPLLAGGPDVESQDPSATYTPTAPTTYYYFIKYDLIEPLYFQRYAPLKTNELRPSGSNPQAEANAAIKATKAAFPDLEIPDEAAEVFTSAEIDCNFGAIGTNSQLDVAANERFYVSGRLYGQFFFGPWFTTLKIDPTGYST